jgi:hypothetical protein
MARDEFLCHMQRRGARRASGFYQTVEGGSELLGLVAGQLESNFVQNLEVARYTHPDQICYIGHSNGWWDPPKTERAAAMAFYLNTKLDLIRLTPGVMEIVRARRWLAPWLYHSRFMDTLGLTVTSPRIKAALHFHQARLSDALIATFMNWEKVEGQLATIEVGRYVDPSRARAYLVTQGAEPAAVEPLSREDSRWTFEIPASPVSAVLILPKPDMALPVVQAEQRNARMLVRVFDPAVRPNRLFQLSVATREARFKRQAELGDTDDAFALRTPPAGPGGAVPAVYGRELGYEDYAGLTQRAHAQITLRDGALSLTTRALVAPHFADPDFEGEQFDATEAHTGTRSLKLPPGKSSLTFFPLELIPGHRYRIGLWVKRIEAGGDVYANVHHHLTNQAHAFGHGAKPNEWVRIETLFDMEPGRDQPHLYLYNWGNSTQPAWFDSVRVEDLGPTPPK